MNRSVLAACLIGMLALAACSEKPQILGSTTRKADGKPWEINPNGYVAQGWKVGDQVSWEEQLQQRARAQNEYLRAPATR